MSKRATTALVSFFFGAFGLQWFILNKPLLGILSILFFWTTIPAWIAWYHIITLLMMDDGAFDKKYAV